MAGSSFFALLDDIATLLDDVSLMTKVAAKKTAGVLGDDLALNAEQVTGVRASRELPVVLAVAKGSFVNKAILVPVALVVSAVAPWLVHPLLMLGGAYLCFEGAEKVAHRLLHSREEDAAHREELQAKLADAATDVVAFEKRKIRGAIRTDFVLSAEIIVIALGTAAEAPFAQRVGVLVAIAVGITVGVYGLVAAIVRLDDAGLHLASREGAATRAFGRGLVAAAPWLMKALSVAGTAAMFLVGGHILVEGVPPVHRAIEALAHAAGGAGAAGSGRALAASLVALLGDALAGLVAGALL
ncbi:MAG: DUF808 domain-containing protein, partial [Myxococcales bacterium]|nr:DUF808 domain-containing protein [Myxococcales bacterium]